MTIRFALLWEVVALAFDTIRGNKMRSALTVLGVVIGITSIVGMTAMIRGFDQSLRGLIAQLGPDTIIMSRFSFTNFVNGDEIRELMKRPNLTISDSRAIEQQSQLLKTVDVELGGGGPGSVQTRVFFRDLKTKPIIVIGTLLGAAIAKTIAAFTPVPAAVELWSVALGIGITAIVGLFFGLYPALRAARLDPIEALRKE